MRTTVGSLTKDAVATLVVNMVLGLFAGIATLALAVIAVFVAFRDLFTTSEHVITFVADGGVQEAFTGDVDAIIVLVDAGLAAENAGESWALWSTVILYIPVTIIAIVCLLVAPLMLRPLVRLLRGTRRSYWFTTAAIAAGWISALIVSAAFWITPGLQLGAPFLAIAASCVATPLVLAMGRPVDAPPSDDPAELVSTGAQAPSDDAQPPGPTSPHE